MISYRQGHAAIGRSKLGYEKIGIDSSWVDKCRRAHIQPSLKLAAYVKIAKRVSRCCGAVIIVSKVACQPIQAINCTSGCIETSVKHVIAIIGCCRGY
ncbi:hypothetical protein D3C80_1614560 [compost metagenome]